MKLVTVVFCDLANSTEISQRYDPEVWFGILEMYFAAISSALTGGGGRIEKFIGDAVVGVFGADTSHEDDALRAVGAALEAIDRMSAHNEGDLKRHNVRLSIRLGIASGRVVITARDSSFAIGSVMNRAARLQGSAPTDSVVLDGKTWLLVREKVACEPLAPVAAKGFERPLRAWRAVRGDPGRDWRRSLVNQVELLTMLHSQVATAVSAKQVTRIGVAGPIGCGKTRILDEFGKGMRRGDMAVLRLGSGGGDAEQGVLRLHEIHRQLGGRPEADHIAVPSARELQWAIRCQLAALSLGRPLVVIMDDYPLAPGVVRELFDFPAGSTGPIIVIAAGRELDGFSDSVLEVPLLSEAESRKLLNDLISDIELHASTMAEDELIERSGGNPLFLQQLAAMAAEGIDGEWPPSAEAALGARIDRLSESARLILACLGAWERNVTVEDLALVCRLDERAFAAGYDELEAAGLDRGKTAGQVAYAHLVLSERAEIHAAIARRFAEQGGTEPSLFDLARSHALRSREYWHELEPGGPHDEMVTSLAANCLAAASRYAIACSEFRAAAEMCAQARELCLRDSALALEIAALESYALGASGQITEALRTIADAESLTGNPSAIAHLKVNETAFTGMLSSETVAIVDRAADPSARARLDLWQGVQHARSGDYPRAERLLRSAHSRVRNLKSCLGATDIYANLALALIYGDTPVTWALHQCHELRREVADTPLLHAKVSCAAALLTALNGGSAQARQMIDAARAVYADLRHSRGEAETCEFAGEVAELAGDYPAARDAMTRAAALYLEADVPSSAALCTARAYVLYPVGDPPETVALDLAGSWVARMLAHQIGALSTPGTDRAAAHLTDAIEELRAVRGVGATIAALASCLRTARLSGDAGLTERITSLLGEAKAKRAGPSAPADQDDAP